MVTLRDILKICPFTTLLELEVRNQDLRLIKKVVIGKDYSVSVHQRYDESKGLFEYIDNDINKHGRADKRGVPEMAYSIDWKQIPKQYLDMEVDMIHSLRDRYIPDRGTVNTGMTLWATVIPIQIQMEV